MGEPKLRFKADDGSDFPNWEEKTLGEICEQLKASIDPRNNPTKQFIEYSMPAYDNHMAAQAVLGQSMNSARKILSAPCVLINKLNVRKRRIWVVEHPEDNAVCSSEFVPLTSAEFDLRFLGYLAMTDSFTGYLLDCSSGSSNSQKRVTPDTILQYLVSLPSLPEQRKIADLLSAVDDVIAAQEAEVAAWEKRKKGVMQKLFSQEVRFKADDGSDFPDWEEKTLGDICMYERQRSEGANFVGTENMLKDFGGVTFDNSNADDSGTLYHPGDTLMSNIRPYLKKAWLADRKGTCSTDVLVFHPTSVEPGYLYWLIASDAFVRYVMSAAKGSKMPRGDKKHIMEMPLLLPNKDEQRKIDDCLSSLNDVIIKAKNELAKWQELKKGLLQQIFV